MKAVPLTKSRVHSSAVDRCLAKQPHPPDHELHAVVLVFHWITSQA
jgi:hypothetical protein